VRADDELPEIPPDLVTVTTRVLSEALLNVERHAQATGVTVTLGHADGELTVAIADDGRGMSAGALAAAAADGHLGVSLMHERARAAGGRLEVRAVPRAGTTLTLRLPVRVAP
jgi:signal transduction histidine kinase